MSTCPNGSMYSLLVPDSTTGRTQSICTNNASSNNNITANVPLYVISSSYTEVMGLMTGCISGPGQGFNPDGQQKILLILTLCMQMDSL